MIILFAFMFLSIMALIFVAFYKRKYNKATVAVVFFIGMSVMIIANTIYQVHIGTLSHDWLQNNRPFYNFIMNIKFSFGDVQRISLIGEIMVLFSFMLLTNVTLIKKTKHYIIYIFLLFCYYVVNNPDILYKLYLAINSSNTQTAFLAKNTYYLLWGLKLFTVCLFFLMPFVVCTYRYFTHKFTIIRRNILLFATVLMMLELLIIILINTDYINSFFELNLTIFYNDLSAAVFTEKAITLVIVTFNVIFFVLIIKNKLFSTNTFDLESLPLYGSSKRLDKTLRMILHTYKNMFLAINQLSKTALSSADKDTKDTVYVSSILDISTDALYNITHLLNMLSNVETTPQNLDIREIINTAITKTNAGQHIKTTVNCPENKYFIFSDSLYITDLVYNIYKNACDAVESSENPTITLNVKSEDDWILLEVIDNGCGIPKDVKKQIFNPLVSTKQGTNNWGIGLYYAKKIAKAHNGYIFVDSHPSKYTKFEIYLPVSTQTETNNYEC